MSQPDPNPPDRFGEYLAAVRACLPLDAITRHAVELLDAQFHERIEAISVAPFPAEVRLRLLTAARQEYTDQLEGLCDTEDY